MAIVQVSRITNRKGLSENLPQLAGAELGWAVDTRRLYIGNGTLEEGAPVIGNTEILTEYSDVLALSGGYTYKGQNAGYTVQTGPSPGTPITLAIQTWMDQWASIKDFGAVGDGVNDDTDAINRALYQLFCRDSNPQIRRSLFFPAGQYVVTDTIVIPPYARLYGEGANSSVLVYRSFLGSVIPFKFGDSAQQTDSNLGNNGATLPTNIEISNLGLLTENPISLIKINGASFCTFSDVSFAGSLGQSDLIDTLEDAAAVRFESDLGFESNNITFRRCEFANATYGIYAADNVKSSLVTESRFDTLHQGVLLGYPTPINGGPTGFRIVGNSFDNVYVEGIKIAAGTVLNASAYNIFYDVGNHFNGVTSPASSIIDIGEANNVSIGDMFERSQTYSTTYPRINLNNTASLGYESADKIKQGVYVREVGKTSTLLNNVSSPTAIFTVDATATRSFQVNYTIVRGTSVCTGTFTVVASTDGTGATLATDNSYVQNASTGVTLSASETASVVTVLYTTTNTGSAGTINYSIRHLA